jgi:uncharacterized protein YutE (UPF0331/DUF86 family)
MSELLDHLDRLTERSLDLSDLGARLQVERVLSALVDLAVAVNTHVVVSTGASAPTDMAASFDRAVVSGLLSTELAAELRKSVGLRNVVVHGYLEVDLSMLAEAVGKAEQYRSYVTAAARWLDNAGRTRVRPDGTAETGL